MLHLYNTMTRRKELFRSREDRIVRMFTCGPSIYGRPHLGNYRTFAWEDVLQRYLEHLGYTVHRLMNMTDVEDKALAEAERREPPSRSSRTKKPGSFSGRHRRSESGSRTRCRDPPQVWTRL